MQTGYQNFPALPSSRTRMHIRPMSTKLAREFNRFEMEDISFDELSMAIIREKGRKPLLNVGMPPEEGKYNESACIRCFKHYTLRESLIKNWRCSCGGIIKKGVKDRVNELASYDTPHHPSTDRRIFT